MIGMMDDLRFLTERRHETLLAEAEARRLAKGSTDEVEGEAPVTARGFERTHALALRSVHDVSGHRADVDDQLTCDGNSPGTCGEGQAAAA